MNSVCEEANVHQEEEGVLDDQQQCHGDDDGQSCCYRMENGQDLIDLKQQQHQLFPSTAWCLEASWEVANKQVVTYQKKVDHSEHSLTGRHLHRVEKQGCRECQGDGRPLHHAGTPHPLSSSRGGASHSAPMSPSVKIIGGVQVDIRKRRC